MKRSLLYSGLLACVVVAMSPVVLAAAPAAVTVAVTGASAGSALPAATGPERGPGDNDARPRRQHGNAVFALGRNAELESGQSADAVIAFGGDVVTAGNVRDAAVALAGNVRATGPVGDGVIAILGDAYLDSSAQTVVAVMGDVELGPDARVSREVVAIGGVIKRDPAAVVTGQEQTLALGRLGRLDGLRSWFRQCGLWARPLALDRDLLWAWGIALGFLALYAVLAVTCRAPVQRCIDTLEQRPGQAALVSLLSLVLVPVAMLLLVVTVVGIIAVPFLGLAVLAATLFGKAVMLVWIGRRVYRTEQPLLPLLIGGVIVLALYLVPLLGFLVYKVLGILGFGVVALTVMRALRSPSPPADTTGEGTRAGHGPVASDAEAQVQGTPPEGAAPLVRAADETLLPRAGFWQRMAALFIDAVLMLIVTHLVARPGARAFFGLLAVYAAVMWQLKGTTIGGSIVGLKLVRTDGKPIDWATAMARALGCLLSLAIGGLGFLWIAFDRERRAWHDRIAGTAVVKVPKGVPLL